MLKNPTPEKSSPGAAVASGELQARTGVGVLKESFALIVERSPDVAHRFYDVLFARYPQTKALFRRNSRVEQEKMLTEALVAVVEYVDDPAWLETNLTILGAKHGAYGVTDEMYAWVGASLLATLAEIAGPDWTPEVESAWTNAYASIVVPMKRGASAAQV